MTENIRFSDNSSGEVRVPGICPALMESRMALRRRLIAARRAVDEGGMEPDNYAARFGMSPDEPLPPFDATGLRMPPSLELSMADLYFGADRVPNKDIIEVSACFTDILDDDAMLEDPSSSTKFGLTLTDVPADSVIGRAALALDYDIHEGQGIADRRGRLQQALCDKKRVCSGPDESGQCPVFGQQGFMRTLVEVMEEPGADRAS